MLQRSLSLPVCSIKVENLMLQQDIYNLQDKLNEQIDLNNTMNQKITMLQNQLAEKNRVINLMIQQSINTKQIKSKRLEKQIYYKENKNCPKVLKIVNDRYGEVFTKAGIPVPWQIFKSVTDELFSQE